MNITLIGCASCAGVLLFAFACNPNAGVRRDGSDLDGNGGEQPIDSFPAGNGGRSDQERGGMSSGFGAMSSGAGGAASSGGASGAGGVASSGGASGPGGAASSGGRASGGTGNDSGGRAGSGGSAGSGGPSGGVLGRNPPSGGSAGAAAPGNGAPPTACSGPRTSVDPSPYGTIHGTSGQWQNVTPSELNLQYDAFNHDDYGAQDVLVDPVRPSDFYGFVCHQGVFKSTDYGATWSKVNTGANGGMIDAGKPWGSNIDSSSCRDPNTPPTLYTLAGNGPMGFFRSTDGGVDWVRIELPDQPQLQYDQDAYSIAVDPYDGAHLLLGFHEVVGLLESTDAGSTWTRIANAGGGISAYYYFVDTGSAQTTRDSWLSISQDGAGMQRTADGGQSWQTVESLTHAHGCNTLAQLNGLLYAGGMYGSQGNGVYQSTDLGQTWNLLAGGNANGVLATPTTLFASYSWATSSGSVDPALRQASSASPTSWTSEPTPSGMINGWKGGSVSSDGTRHVVVTGNWNAGFWRYVE